ncbi:MAG: energy-coupling factor transporter transmembrane protein EcfT [Oscillospiraceae bacterium]|jgi:energy-coupling factor transport system permease protein|nr:energy-coupling factor transporter transmembrane protein EcfT [Oscillospiraceae bacterium]
MKNQDAFARFHPVVNLLYFVLVTALSFLLMHPVCLGVSLFCAFTYSLALGGKKALRFALWFQLPVLLLTALINPAFSHAGATILTYLPSGNPLTLESIAYGVAAAVLLLAVLNWFTCFNAVMTSDKFIYLFGRAIPALSLVLSMALRFVPRFVAQAKVIANAQKCIGRDPASGNILQRARAGLKILSILVTWALENAVETADSMKSRGYGLPGRTAFSIFHLERRDFYALLFLLLCGGYLVCGTALGGLQFSYFPVVQGVWNPYAISLFAAYLALCALPLIIDQREAHKWKTA